MKLDQEKLFSKAMIKITVLPMTYKCYLSIQAPSPDTQGWF